mmetsp:Transcript_25193/g.58573  ORF Transcript_25193/g.58573 Transcript_25193/m.58573 type:complete len:174 (-) Transcript_25193:125-646(-)
MQHVSFVPSPTNDEQSPSPPPPRQDRLSILTNGLSSLKEVWLDDSPMFTGATIPISLPNKLEILSLHSIGLVGTIPSELSDLSSLEQLWLGDNHLTGMIPSELSQLTRLDILQLQGNAFSGNMPTEICHNNDLGHLTYLGADCPTVECSCCSCCGLQECILSSPWMTQKEETP